MLISSFLKGVFIHFFSWASNVPRYFQISWRTYTWSSRLQKKKGLSDVLLNSVKEAIPIDVGEIVRETSYFLFPLAQSQKAWVNCRDCFLDLLQHFDEMAGNLTRIHKLSLAHLVHQCTQLFLTRLWRIIKVLVISTRLTCSILTLMLSWRPWSFSGVCLDTKPSASANFCSKARQASLSALPSS